MALSPEVRSRLQARIDELKKRMQYDANDLDYETHLNQVRELQKIITAASKSPAKISPAVTGTAKPRPAYLTNHIRRYLSAVAFGS